MILGFWNSKKASEKRVISHQLHQLPGQLHGHPIENRLKLLVIQEEVQHIPHSSVNTSREILKKALAKDEKNKMQQKCVHKSWNTKIYFKQTLNTGNPQIQIRNLRQANNNKILTQFF